MHYRIVWCLFLLSFSINAEDVSSQPSYKEAENKTDSQACWFGRCDKSAAILEPHYQTGFFSTTRLRLFFWLRAHTASYKVDVSALKKALYMALERDDDGKVALLLEHGFGAQEFLAFALVHGAEKSLKLLLAKKPEISIEHLEAIQQCREKAQTTPYKTPQELKLLDQKCIHCAGIVEGFVDTSNKETESYRQKLIEMMTDLTNQKEKLRLILEKQTKLSHEYASLRNAFKVYSQK